MKRCPECRRDYYDDSLKYCLDDGATLLDGPADMKAVPASPAEAATVILKQDNEKNAGPASVVTAPRIIAVSVLLAVLLAGGGYWYLSRTKVASTLPQLKNDNLVKAKILLNNESRDDVKSAISILEQTVKDDPQYAAGWAQLARAYNKQAFYFASTDERKRLDDEAELAAERSLSIDPNLADGHFARGLILWTHAKRFPHDLAIQSYKKAIALDPNLDEAHHQLALVYLHIGLFDKARSEIARTLEINPANTLARFRYGVIDLYERKYDDAYTFFNSTSPDQTPALQTFQLATVLFKLGRTDDAQAMIEKYLRDNPRDEGGVATSVEAMILAQRGRFDEADAAIKRANDIGHDFGHFHHTAFNIACAYALMNKADEAVTYLQLAADDGLPCFPMFDSEESFASIRNNPRFTALMTKLKQQWETYNAAYHS